MSKASSRIEYYKAKNAQAYQLKADQRRYIERRYGHAIAPDAWEKIEIRTTDYTMPESAKLKAPPRKIVTRKLKSFTKAASNLRVAFDDSAFNEPEKRDKKAKQKKWSETDLTYENSDALYAAHIAPFKGSRYPIPETLIDLLDSAIAYSRFLNQERFYSSNKRWGRWNYWVRDIFEIMLDEGLPTASSHYEDDEEPSDFVRLIQGLQEHMPSGCARINSKASLSVEISDALHQTKE